MNIFFKKHSPINLAVFVLALMLSSQVSAEIQCGDTLGPGGNYKLKHDLECDVSPALTLHSRTHLNLNNYTIKANEEVFVRICILLDGEKSSVSNGYVSECDQGVVVGGTGKHQVKQVVYTHSRPSTHQGFYIQAGSDHNLLLHNTATAGDGCFEINSNFNRLIGNTAFDGPGVGFWIARLAEYNRLLQNTAINHVAHGFLVQGSNNSIIKNEALDNGFISAHFTGSGFTIANRSSGNKLYNNKSTDNSGTGIEMQGSEHIISGNVTENNQAFGIDVTGTNSRIVRNLAFDNGITDLQDVNPECDHNKWKNNKFETRNAVCIE